GLAGRVAATAFIQTGTGTAAALGLWTILAAGGALAALGLGLAFHGSRGGSRAPSDPPATTGEAAAAAAPMAPPAALAVAAAMPAAEPPPAAPQAAALPPAGSSDFSLLSEMQQDILKKFWEHRKVSPDRPPQRWGFRPSENSPDLMAFEMAVSKLAARGWVEGAPKTGMIFLTDQGAAYCASVSADIDAHPAKPVLFRDALSRPEAGSAAVEGSEFGVLPETQKDILKTLWEHQKVNPNQGWAYRPGPNNPDLADFEAAAAGLQPTGLIKLVGRNGMVALTPKGSEFCLAHASELDAYALKRQSFRPSAAQQTR
ncbi:MAG TPA: hypothetical protein VG838_15150, partial [Opitutaceae bacterium]|nr:hypothetical protein [Opitutaceae bacterium]